MLICTIKFSSYLLALTVCCAYYTTMRRLSLFSEKPTCFLKKSGKKLNNIFQRKIKESGRNSCFNTYSHCMRAVIFPCGGSFRAFYCTKSTMVCWSVNQHLICIRTLESAPPWILMSDNFYNQYETASSWWNNFYYTQRPNLSACFIQMGREKVAFC